MMTAPEPQRDPEPLPSLADEGDRPSITEVNGTVARFEMAYQPEPSARHMFGAPLWHHVPATLWFLFTVGIAGTVVAAYQMTGSALYVWVAERERAFPPTILAFIVLASGIAVLARSFMRGVIVHKEGVEARAIIPPGIPRVRRWAWAQIHRVVLDERGVMLELWTGEYEKLPSVAHPTDLGALLEQLAAQHGIAVTRLRDLGN
jgi:hypothetical protein